jgi:drug/metabolite transporter (DMT)-like permease
VGILYLGLFGTVLGFVWYYEGIRQIGPSRAAVFINVVPVSGVFFGWWLLGEPVNGSLLAGGALVLAGVALTNRSPVVPPVTAPVPPPAAKGKQG